MPMAPSFSDRVETRVGPYSKTWEWTLQFTETAKATGVSQSFPPRGHWPVGRAGNSAGGYRNHGGVC